MKKFFTKSILSFGLLAFMMGWQPTLNAQGTCATAVALVLDANCAGSPSGGGANSGDPTGDDGTDGNVCSTNYSGGDDYIFEYTATTTDALKLSLWATNTWTGILVTAGCPTTGTCFASATSSSANKTLTTPAMTIGQIYYIHISTFPAPQSAGQFCLDAELMTPPMPPANDNCGGAFPLTVNPDENCTAVTNGTIALATASPESTTTCSGTEDDDVWFSFVATATTHSISIINITGSTTDLYHSLWTGGCGSLVGTGLCSDPNSSTATGLTIGTTYYLRVYSWTSTTGQTSVFDVCIGTPAPPPVNDVCSGAIAYPGTIGAPGTCPGNTVSLDLNPYNNSTDGFPSCDASGNYNAWFTFTAPAAGLTFTSGTGLPGIAIYSGACGALTELACLNNVSGNITGLTPSATYLMEIWDDSDGSGTVTWCLEETPGPPANDACAGAIPLVSGGSASGSNVSATNVEGFSPCSGGGGASGCDPTMGDGTIDWGPGVWYSYTSTGAENVTVEVNGFDTEVQVFEGSCGSLTCIGGDDDSSTAGCCGSAFCWLSTASFAPVTYYIYVDGHASNTGTFVLNLSATALPVTLVSFKGEKMEKGNKLTWVTASEQNTEAFHIERSADGINWQKIGQQAAAGFATAQNAYEFMDEAPLAKSIYRLRSSDFDGSSELSNVLTIEREFQGFRMTNVYPQPVRDNLTVQFNNDRNSRIALKVTDLMGRVVFTDSFDANDGVNDYNLEMSAMASGVYFLSMEDGTRQLTQRIVKN